MGIGCVDVRAMFYGGVGVGEVILRKRGVIDVMTHVDLMRSFLDLLTLGEKVLAPVGLGFV